MSETSTKSQNRRLQWISWAVLILSPFLLLGILSIVLGENAFNAQPAWLDELSFWRSLYSWDLRGFGTGYNGMFEEAATVGTLGISGLGPILIYGWFVKLFGLSMNSILLCNAVWISLGALVFCAVRKPRPAVAFSIAAMVMSYMPIILYSLTSMTELFNYALMLFYLAFLLRYQEKRSLRSLIACTLTVLFGCLYRPMYCVLFIPLVMFFSRYQLSWRMVLSAAVAIGLSVLAYLLSALAAAPNAQGFPYHLFRAENLETAFCMLLSHSKANLMDYFSSTGHLMQDVFRWMYMGLTVLCLMASFLALERRGLRPVRLNPGFRPPFFSCFLLLVAAFGLTIMFYEAYDWRDFRRLAPYLWLVIAFFIARHRFTLPVVSLAACLVTTVLLFTVPGDDAFSDANRFDPCANDDAMSAVIEVIAFDEEAQDPFYNTIRTDVYSAQMMRELHPGMGLQYGWFTTDTTGKSRWILTDQLKCPVSGYENVLDTGAYKLYRQIPKED